MPQISVRNVDDAVYAGLKARAEANQRSLEAEIRVILGRAVAVSEKEEFRRWSEALRATMPPGEPGTVTNDIRADRER